MAQLCCELSLWRVPFSVLSFLARTLGASSFGVYSFVFAIVTLLALPAQLGIPTLLVRETASALVRQRWSSLKGLWLWSTRAILLSSLAIAVLAILTVWLSPAAKDGDFKLTLLGGLLLVPMMALGGARAAAMRGLNLIISGQFPDSIIRPIFLILFVGLYWNIKGDITASAAMYWHVAAAGVAFAIGAAMLWRARPAALDQVESDFSDSTKWRQAAIPLAMVSGLQVIGNQVGLVLLGLFRPDSDVAFYKVAVSAALLTAFGLQVVNLIISPHISRLYASDDISSLARLARLGAIGGTAVTVPLFLFLVFFGKEVLLFVYGAQYLESYWPLVVLAVGQVINAGFGSSGVLLNMTGHERVAIRWLGVSSATNLAFSFLLIPDFGPIGAAFGSTIGLVVWNIAFWIMVQKNLNLDCSLLSMFRIR